MGFFPVAEATIIYFEGTGHREEIDALKSYCKPRAVRHP